MGADRRVPGWAPGLLAGLACDQPIVVTRADVAERLAEAGSTRSVDRTVDELRRLGWLAPLHLHGVWAFIPPGLSEIVDPYLGLRAWQARDPGVVFRLAGDNAAWHLGYLARQPGPPVSLWLPAGVRIPDGLRSSVTAVRLRWPSADAARLGPSPQLLLRRRLDSVGWSSYVPAFGPEALLVQVATRPASLRSWADLVEHLDRFTADVDVDRAAELLTGQSASAWQRAAYLLDCGHQARHADELFARRPSGDLPAVAIGTKHPGRGDTVFSSRFRIVDHLVAALQRVVGKA